MDARIKGFGTDANGKWRTKTAAERSYQRNLSQYAGNVMAAAIPPGGQFLAYGGAIGYAAGQWQR